MIYDAHECWKATATAGGVFTNGISRDPLILWSQGAQAIFHKESSSSPSSLLFTVLIILEKQPKKVFFLEIFLNRWTPPQHIQNKFVTSLKSWVFRTKNILGGLGASDPPSCFGKFPLKIAALRKHPLIRWSQGCEAIRRRLTRKANYSGTLDLFARSSQT